MPAARYTARSSGSLPDSGITSKTNRTPAATAVNQGASRPNRPESRILVVRDRPFTLQPVWTSEHRQTTGTGVAGLPVAIRTDPAARSTDRTSTAPGLNACGGHPDYPTFGLAQPARHPQIEVVSVTFDAAEGAGQSTIIDGVFAQGPIDCVISAFGQLGADVDLVGDPDAVRHIATVNYVAAITTGTMVVNHLKRQGYGTFVVLSSVAAERARADNYVYASTKAGLDAWASGLADSLARSGIHVLVVRPGFVHTSMTQGLTPAPLATTAEAVAEATVKGIRNRSPLVWAPSSVRPLMAAMRHLPRPVFRFVSDKAGK